MRIDHLIYFIAVVENTSYLEAAEKLNLSQSALSKTIMKLEETLNVKLFDRSTRRVTLTPVGELVYRDAKQLLERYDVLINDVHAFQEASNQTIVLGALPTLFTPAYTIRFKKYRDSHPEVNLMLSEEDDEKLLLDSLLKEQIKLASLRKGALSDNRFHFYPIAHERLCLVVPANHPLAERVEVSLSELKNEQFILYRPTNSLYQLCLDACLEAGFEPNILLTARAESILSSVSIGLGISLMTENTASAFTMQDQIAIVSLMETVITSLGIASPKGRVLSLCEQELIEMLCE